MKHLLLLLVLVFSGVTIMAQNRLESFNYKKGLESLQNENPDEALEFFNKDLQENPQNGYSYSWVAMICNDNEEYGKALNAANMAVRYIPKKDKEYVNFAYTIRGNIYLNLQDTAKALSDYSTAIVISPEVPKLYELRAEVYYEQERYDLSDADYHKFVELSPGGTDGYMGLGRNANAQEKWEEAIKQFDYVVKLKSDYAPAYTFRAEAYLGLKKWDYATNDLLTALTLDFDTKAIYLMCHLNEQAIPLMTTKLRIQVAKYPDDSKWPYLLGFLYEQKKQYDKAVTAYNYAIEKDPSPDLYYRVSICQYEEGLYCEALQSIDKILDTDSIDVYWMVHRADILDDMGKTDLAVVELDTVLLVAPDFAWGYYKRGWLKYFCDDMDGAVEDLTMSIILDPEETCAYACRGNAYTKMGQRDLAEADYKKIIEIESAPDKYEYIQYAYLALGQKDKAIEAMDTILARDPKDAGNHYDAACIYSKMQDKEKSLKHLEKAFELGYVNFVHVERDDDLNFVRSTEEFKALLNKYKSNNKARTTSIIHSC